MGSIVAEIADKIASAGGGERSELEVRGGTGADGGGILTLSTSELTVVDGDKLGRIDFQAPVHDGTGDALLVAASIYAEADDTFAADNNSTELVFAVGASEAAAEKMRLTHDGELGIGVATPASLLHVAGTVQVGVDDTGHDVVFYGDAAGAFAMWDTSANSLLVRGAAADAVGSTGRIVLQTAQPDVRAADVLGRIDFQAPLDTQGSDGALVTASITGVAEETFTATVNGTALTFSTADGDAVVEAMRITHDGFVGIGTTTIADRINLPHAARIKWNSHGGAAGARSVAMGNGYQGSSAQDNYWSLAMSNADDNTIDTAVITIDNAANVGIGSTTPAHKLDVADAVTGDYALGVYNSTNADGTHGIYIECAENGGSTGSTFINFAKFGGTNCGEVQKAGSSSVTYSTSSDKRLKENIVAVDDAIDTLKAFSPKKFNFKEDDASVTVNGFIAQEAKEFCPEAVRGTEDEKYADGSIHYMGIDYGRFTPYLWAICQEQQTLIETLTSKVTALENA